MEMVYCGSNNNTAKQMADFFGHKIEPKVVFACFLIFLLKLQFPQVFQHVMVDFEEYARDIELKTAQGMLIANNELVSDDYIKILTDYFDADVFYGDRENAIGLINNWVAKHTNGKIEKLLSDVPE
jgi:serine protease inhibitor